MESNTVSLKNIQEKYPKRVQAILNILMETPYFYASDNEDLFLFLRRHREEFRRFYHDFYGWELILDRKCARVYKSSWYNEKITPANRNQFNLSRRDECIAFMILLQYFEHLLEDQALTVESSDLPRFRFGEFLEYCRREFITLGFDEEKYSLEMVRSDILRPLIPKLLKFRFLAEIKPEGGEKVKSFEEQIFEAQPALYHYNAGNLRQSVNCSNDPFTQTMNRGEL